MRCEPCSTTSSPASMSATFASHGKGPPRRPRAAGLASAVRARPPMSARRDPRSMPTQRCMQPRPANCAQPRRIRSSQPPTGKSKEANRPTSNTHPVGRALSSTSCALPGTSENKTRDRLGNWSCARKEGTLVKHATTQRPSPLCRGAAHNWRPRTKQPKSATCSPTLQLNLHRPCAPMRHCGIPRTVGARSGRTRDDHPRRNNHLWVRGFAPEPFVPWVCPESAAVLLARPPPQGCGRTRCGRQRDRRPLQPRWARPRAPPCRGDSVPTQCRMRESTVNCSVATSSARFAEGGELGRGPGDVGRTKVVNQSVTDDGG